MKKLIFASPHSKLDLALLLLRIGIGIDFILHGYPKITGGQQMWTELGGSMQNLGISVMPVVWGFLAALAEFGGGTLLLIGLFTRIAAFGMFCTMLVAMITILKGGGGFGEVSQSVEMAVLFVFLLLTGAGKYSIDEGIREK